MLRPLHPLLFPALSLGLVGLSLNAGCRKDDSEPTIPSKTPSVSSTKPIDRLSPEELGPSESRLFGLPVPRGMTVQGSFSDFAIATGKLKAEAVARYVKDYVVADRVELSAAGTTYPAVRIKEGPPDRFFRIEVTSDGPSTRLLVRDITPPPAAPVQQNLSAEELWRRAGFSRDGKPLDLRALE